MVNPWGSPWENHDTCDQQPACPGSLEPPPRVVLSVNASSGFGSHLSLSSPWRDDSDGDGGRFSDWATPEPTNTAVGLNPWASWGDASNKASQRRDSSAPRDSSPRKGLLATWPTGTASPPSLKHLPHARTPTVLSPALSRRSSFDLRKPDLSFKTTLEQHDASSSDHPACLTESPDALEGIKEQPPYKQTEEREKETAWGSISITKTRVDENADAKNGDRCEKSLDVELSGNSRPSTRSSNTSARVEITRESPVTSIDEDVGDVSSQRTAPSKAQDLVYMYDGLAKSIKVTGVLPANQIRSRGSQGSLSNRSMEDRQEFGDFEDASSHKSTPEPFQAPPPVQYPHRNEPGKHWDSDHHHQDGWQKTSSPVSPAYTKTSQKQNVAISIPFEKLEELFPSKEDTKVNTKPDRKRRESLYNIIHDTFTEISERKAWYRISRFGSILRNDAPDFENYVSVPWASTGIHDDTINTVQRWMQGARLGSDGPAGGGYRSSGFGWDSSAPTVSMEEIFDRKRSSRTKSPSMNDSPEAKSHITSLKSVPSSNTASFGWSSVPTELAAPPKEPVPSNAGSRDILSQTQAYYPPFTSPASILTSSPQQAPFCWGSVDILDRQPSTCSTNPTPPVSSALTDSNVHHCPNSSAPVTSNSSRPTSQPVSASTTAKKSSVVLSSPTKPKGKDNHKDEDDDDEEWGDMVSPPNMDPSVNFSSFLALAADPNSQSLTISEKTKQPLPPPPAKRSTARPKSTSGGTTTRKDAKKCILTPEDGMVTEEIVGNLPESSFLLQH